MACDTAGVGVNSPPAATQRLDAVGGQYFQRTFECRLRQGVRIDADEQRTIDAVAARGTRRWPA